MSVRGCTAHQSFGATSGLSRLFTMRLLLTTILLAHICVGKQNTHYATMGGSRPIPDALISNEVEPFYDDDVSSYISYMTSSGVKVYPKSYNATSIFLTNPKQDRSGYVAASRHINRGTANEFYSTSSQNPIHRDTNYTVEDFSSYSQDELDRLGSMCYQYHYHYGPLYDVDQALKSAAYGLKSSVRRTAAATARNFYYATSRLGNAIARSGKHFGRFLAGAGGKVILLVVVIAALLTLLSLFSIYLTVISGQGGLGRALSDVLQQLVGLETLHVAKEARLGASEHGPTYNALNILMMLEEAFQKLDVVDFDCQQRVMCEAHEADAIEQYGDAALRLQKIIGSADTNATEGAANEVKSAYEAFRDAAVKGAQQESCARTYAAKCSKGLRELAAKKY